MAPPPRKVARLLASAFASTLGGLTSNGRWQTLSQTRGAKPGGALPWCNV